MKDARQKGDFRTLCDTQQMRSKMSAHHLIFRKLRTIPRRKIDIGEGCLSTEYCACRACVRYVACGVRHQFRIHYMTKR